MINNIPVSLLSRIGMYEVDIDGAKVKVSLVDNSDVVVAKLQELKSSLQILKTRVVGVDIKFVKCDFGGSFTAKLLVLCVGTRCLIIQLQTSEVFPETLVQFLSDETICFLGIEMSNIVRELGRRCFYHSVQGRINVKCNTGVEVGYLAAKILKKANIEKNGLAELAGEAGMDIMEPKGKCPDWNAIVFSDEEIKYAMHNAYTSYVIGNKLFSMV